MVVYAGRCGKILNNIKCLSDKPECKLCSANIGYGLIKPKTITWLDKLKQKFKL